MSTTAEKFSFKPMLAVVLSGETLDVQWLNEHGVGALRASQLAQAGWLTHLGRGAYTLHGDTLKREKCLALPCLALPCLADAPPSGIACGRKDRAPLARNSS
ncbi:AbiEi antitoxin N-terminal domain-containing protein [Variovorax sp. J22G73]|uniref:AbiEi antitoxin N-terminal domain-containing protein n=1 Tax=unclassified Variovorax TaxID=663243 RepID=UPI00257539AB|nr:MULTISPECIES: AbiEi antitoxin N-terminal domain-containing protein [unclassified Variovorax]MDM0004801.1 AbiEi antitoxin N-terminal domain-containing protein [Variovorax sp. J22R203]MDM0098217.1 AbiEi antitoxin N-terminal domain-containing protein [Variovorax sp. J22G73]